MTLSNITCSASAGEASGSSGTRTTDDGNTAPPAATPATTTTTVSSGQPPGPGQKRKRNLPGTPDPEAEVVALSPKTLMATNRFVCEICNKGFQRDQNLQLHRRGHNLPWKLRQRSSKEIIRKRVYICPEASCVHHDPSRALGDLTGIKKHFCRKHGEKKWKCDKCSKRYAVQSDWKAHSKTCGTREYRCDCGTLFSRRDSFITHRAFCDALAEESARVSAGKQYGGSGGGDMMSSSSMMMQATQVGGSMSVLAGTLSLTSSPHHGNNMNLGRVSADSLASIAAATGGGGGSGSMQRQAPLAPSMGGLGRLGHEAAGLSLLPPRWGQSVGNAGAAASATGAPGPRLSLWLGSGPGPAGGLPAPGSQQVQLLPAASDVSSSSPFLMQPPKVAMHDGGAAGLQPAILNPLEYDIPQAPRPTSSSGLLLPMVSSGTGSMFAHLFSSAPGSTMPGLHGGSSSTNNNIPANTAGAGASMLLQGGMGISGFSDFTAGASQTERRGGGSATAGLSLSSSLSAGLSSCSSSVYNDGVGSVPSVSMLFNHQQQQQQQQQQHTATAQMSATALLQKAAQMGATASSSSSLLRGFGGMGVPGDSSSMSFWQNQQQRMQDQGRGAVELPPNKLSMVQSLQQQQQQIRRPIDISSGGGPLGVGTSMGPSNFGGSQVRPTNDHHVGGVAAAAAAAGMQDFMNSLSGGAGLFVGPLSNMPSMFGPNSGNVTGGMMQPPNNHHHHHHRMLPNDVMAHHHNNNPYHSGGGGGPMSQGMGGQPSSMLPGLGGSTRGEDGSDRFTHDFLGVGGAPSGMAAAAGGMGRTLSQRDLASLASLGPGVDLGAIFNQRENLRSVGARVHSPAKSWDAS